MYERVAYVAVGRHDVEVAREDDRHASLAQGRRMGDQALEPRWLIDKLRTGLGIAVR